MTDPPFSTTVPVTLDVRVAAEPTRPEDVAGTTEAVAELDIEDEEELPVPAFGEEELLALVLGSPATLDDELLS